jgi:hypothetical protein
MTLPEALAEIETLRARVSLLEAALATIRGTLATPEPEEEPDASWITHDVPGNAPR